MDICKENGAYDAKHFLCYYYYGGMIYTGLKNFERALYFYEQVFCFKNSLTYVNLIKLVLFLRYVLDISPSLLPGNNHSRHGSEPHYVGSL